MEHQLIFQIEYPDENSTLYSNINVAGGYCFHTSEPIHSIKLFINDHLESEAMLKYPRLDIASEFPDFGELSLFCGFSCYFNYARLPEGKNVFDFYIYSEDFEEHISRTVVKEGDIAPQKVDRVFIDICSACNLHCLMCPHGNLDNVAEEGDTGLMPAELFDQVVSHLIKTGYMSEYLDLYTWGEPLLNPEIGEILDICHDNKIKAIVSTNLSLPADRVAMMTQHNVDLLLVSISGFSEETYAKNHVGGDFSLVRRNLESLKNHRNRIKDVVIKYLVFKYNREEIELAKSFCENNGFKFGAYMGAIPCPTSFFRYVNDCGYRTKVEEFIYREQIKLQPARFCPQEATISLNHEAELVQCCMSWHQGNSLPLFEADIREYLNHRMENEFCIKCLSSGYCHYTHFGRNSPELLFTSVN